jgi:hypothetical protein
MSLTDDFKKAGLALRVATASLHGVGNDDIFQIDIKRGLKGNDRTEHFRIWPGKDSTVQVSATDKCLRQVVLLVHEPKRSFAQRARKSIYDTQTASWKKAHKILKVIKNRRARFGDDIEYEEFTPSRVRHYLCGVDERQLFIAECPRAVTSVKAAHDSLKGDARIKLAEDSSRRVTRQGEWFFLEASEQELQAIEQLLHKNKLAILKKRSLGRGGHPHIADEVIIMSPKILEHGWPVQADDTFIRGCVRHVDHKTVRFTNWRKVIRNNEGSTTNAAAPGLRAGGVLWVD